MAYDGPVTRFREVADEPGVIDIHIIEPGWGSAGYYTESVLSKACSNKVYPSGVHMHIDHPTRAEANENPARTILGDSPIAAIFVEDAHYEEAGWDGAGPYTKAKILPEFREKLHMLGGHIGISHYVDGVAKEGLAPDGKKGKIITELLPSPLNTVDFVTVPGAGGGYRTMFAEAKQIGSTETTKIEENMPNDKLTLAEIKDKHQNLLDEYAKEIQKESNSKDLKKKSDDQGARIKTLEVENGSLKQKIAEKASTDFVMEEVKKAKLPEPSAKIVVESLKSKATIAEDGTIDVIAFGAIVKEAIEAKVAEVEAIRKDSPAGITSNGQNNQDNTDHEALTAAFVESYRGLGYDADTAKNMAELAAAGRR